MSVIGPFGSATLMPVLSFRFVAADSKTMFSPAPVMNALRLGPSPCWLTSQGSPFDLAPQEKLTISMKSFVGADLPPPARFGSVRLKMSRTPFLSSLMPEHVWLQRL